jgi:hypothetical protein
MRKHWPKEVSIEELTCLPLRAVVAYAARCARRARPQYVGAEEDVLDQAILIAERFAQGKLLPFGFSLDVPYRVAKTTITPFPTMAAYSAAHAAQAAVLASDPGDKDRRDVAFWAYQASVASGSALLPSANPMLMPDVSERRLQAQRADYDSLMSLNLGKFPDLGQPVAASENGSLGLLWPEGPPKLD